MEISLTENAIHHFWKTFDADNDAEELSTWHPIVQVVSCKAINTGPDQPSRNRLVISDGNYWAQSMLATQLNDLVTDGQIQKNTIIRMKKFHASRVQGKRLIIILDVEPMSQVDNRIGEPVNIEQVLDGTTPAPSSVKPSTTTTPAAPAGFGFAQAKSEHSSAAPNPVQSRAVGTAAPATIHPIESLNPYQNKWVIKVRVTQKSDIRTFSGKNGEGKLFTVTLMDETGEIRATAFNNVVDDLYDKLEEGKVYYISKARVNIAKKKFNNTGGDFEIALDKLTQIEECMDASGMPSVSFNFVELAKLEEKPKDSTCDVIGIVKQVGDFENITTRAGKSLSKRDLTLVDKSQYSVRVTLWGKQAENFVAENQPVVAFKNVKIGDFGGRTLSLISTSTIHPNPDISEAHLLRGWFDREGHATSFTAQSSSGGGGGGTQGLNRKDLLTIAAIRDSNIGKSDNADFFSCRGTIIFIRNSDSIMYTACPAEKCNKKVNETSSGDWRCEKCDRSYPQPDHRYLMAISVADHTGQLWLQAFNEVGQQVIGMTARDLYDLQMSDAAAATAAVTKAQGSTWNFSCRAKQDTFNDNSRTRYGINRVWSLDYLAEGRALLDQLQQYSI
ncbi:Replication factor A protein 1 [Tulasnella sp. 418]|nr:Replication factor A protein 1 [Tulasnella sp. 418]